MNNPPQSAGFPSTRWTWIVQIKDADPQARRRALEDLLKLYLPALQTYLQRACRLDADRAEEISQGFVVEKVLERDLFATADPAKGRLRSLVLRSLKNYFIDQVRRTDKQTPLPDDSAFSPAAVTAPPQDVFDAAWARQVLSESLRRMRNDCHTQNRPQVWELFEARVIRPTLTGSSPVDYSTLVRQFSLGSPEQASNALMNAKRQFRQVLKAVVAEYAPDEEVESEINDLQAIIAAAGPLNISSPGIEAHEDGLAKQFPTDVTESTPSFLADLFADEIERDLLWSEAELEGILEHQLRIPISEVLTECDELPVRLAEAHLVAKSCGIPLTNLGDLLTHPAPPLKLLDAAKRWARSAVRDESGGLPAEIASLFYFAAIAAAMVRHGNRLTKSDDETLRYGFMRMLSKCWVPSPICDLFRAALEQIAEVDQVG